MNLASAIYMPQLKWKDGERRAVGSARGSSSGRLLPLFRIPPAGAFDHAEGRTLGTAEYIRGFGAKLRSVWAGGLVFVDADLIDDDRHHSAVGRHALTELLERARQAGVMACPVTSFSRTTAYQTSVKRFRELNAGWPICLRIGLSEMDLLADPARLSAFLSSIGALRSETVLLIDASSIHIPDKNDLATLVIEALSSLDPSEPFAKIFWSATTFPEKHGLKAGEIGRWARDDWSFYKHLLSRRDEMSVLPLYSDYALEYPAYFKPVQTAPTAHLRYSSAADYIMVRGTTTRKPHGYRAILPVAKRLAETGEFLGKDASLGNAFVMNLIEDGKRTGNASSWRWASTDHHLTLVLSDLRKIFGLQEESVSEAEEENQLQLI